MYVIFVMGRIKASYSHPEARFVGEGSQALMKYIPCAAFNALIRFEIPRRVLLGMTFFVILC